MKSITVIILTIVAILFRFKDHLSHSFGLLGQRGSKFAKLAISLIISGLAISLLTLGLTTEVTAVSLSPDTSLTTTLSPLAPLKQTGVITGTVFRDYDADGTRDVNEPPFTSPITVTAYSDVGQVARTQTLPDGMYSLNIAPNTVVRLEFTGLPSWVQPGAAGTDNETSAAFVNVGAGGTTVIDFGLNNPDDYCQSNPTVVAPCFLQGDPLKTGSDANTGDTIASVDFNRTQGQPPTHVATGVDTGAIWGIAYQRSSEKLYSAAVLKRHSGYGPLGQGGIYVTDYSGGVAGATTNFIDLNTLGINTGLNPRLAAPGEQPGYDTAGNRPGLDNATYDAVGKVGLGDIDISEDNQFLWVMNLADRTLYSLNIGLVGNTPTAGDVTAYPVPNPICTDGEYRPWAVKAYQDKIYVGIVCSNETINPYPDPPPPGTANFIDYPNLQGFVYELDPTTATYRQVLFIPLNYQKGCAMGGRGCQWFPWTDLTTANQVSSFRLRNRRWRITHPTPILSDIEFSDDGDMLLGFTDRTGFQYGVRSPFPNSTNLNTRVDMDTAGGEILRADFSGGSWTLESNGVVGGVNGAGMGNNQGPGGGEFYSTSTRTHHELSLGGLAILPGSGQVVMSAMDPTNINQGGLIWMNNANGRKIAGFQYYTSGRGPTLAKGVGIGDVELLCNAAPIEIGNRVWFDADRDGIQDPGETPLSGVEVVLYLAGTPVATATTDANGNYLFSSDTNRSSTGSSIYTNQMQPNTPYEIRLNLTQSAVSSYTLTLPNAGSNSSNDNKTDLNDSDGQVNGNFAVIGATTGNAGENNHTLDFGFAVPTATIQIDPDGVNRAGDPHTFTITTTWSPAITPTSIIITPTVSPAPNQQSTSCATPTISRGVATCTLTINSNVVGIFTATAQAAVNVPNVLLNVTTDGVNGNSDGAIKVYEVFDLALRKRLAAGQPPVIYPTNEVTFTLTLFNQGTVTATNITLSDYLPAGFSLSPNDTNGWTGSGSTVTTTLSGPLSPGISTTLNIVLTAGSSLAPGNHINWAEITEAQDEEGNTPPDVDSTPDGDNTNDGPVTDDELDNNHEDEDDHDPAQVAITDPRLDISKVVSTLESVPQQVVSYTIHITNTGNLLLNTVALTDTFDPGLAYLPTASPPPDAVNGQTLFWHDLTGGAGLAPNATLTVTLQATVVTTQTGIYHNLVETIGATPITATLLVTDTVPVAVTDPSVALGKSLNGPIRAGLITYTIQLTNTGPSPLDVLPLFDTFSGPIAYAGGTPPADVVDNTNQQLRWHDLTNHFGNLPPGQTVTLVTLFIITSNQTEVNLTNQVTVPGSQTSDTFGNTPITDTTVTVTLTSIPTAVSLLDFSVTWQAGQVLLTWQTAVEYDNLGFNVVRSETSNLAEGVEVAFIPGQGSGTHSGATYTFLDAATQPNQTYTYWLIDLDAGGNQTPHGPLTLTPLSGGDIPSQLYLPLLLR